MQKNLLSTKQATYILIMFIFGNALMYGGSKAKQDSWIAILISLLMFAPIMLMYARTVKLYPGQNLYDIIMDVFGKFFGKVVILLYVLYAIQMAAFLIRYFSEFVRIAAMPETPQYVLLIGLFALSVWMVKSGVVILGRWAKFTLPIVLLSVLITALISIGFMNFNNIKPIAGTEFSKLMDSSFTSFAFPLAETVLFLVLFSSIKKQSSPYKIYSFGLLISAVFMILAVLRNIFVLGFPSLGMYYFPSYTSVSVASLGDFFTRIEVLIGMAFLLDLFVKLCVCMFAASMGVSKIFNNVGYKNLAIPVGLIVLALSSILYSDIIEIYKWIDVYKYYALPFQVIFPLIIYIVAEVKNRKKKKLQTGDEKGTDGILCSKKTKRA